MKMPEPGMQAPNFRAPDQTGQIRTLSEFKGKNVVLFFYPEDDTPDATIEACGFRDQIDRFQRLNTEIIGVSTDDVEDHREFAKKLSLPFTLLADPEGEIVQSYNVGEKRAHPTTYLIGPDGEVLEVYPKVDPENHARQVLEELETGHTA